MVSTRASTRAKGKSSVPPADGLCRLLALPGEIRNIIYEYVLGEPQSLYLCAKTGDQSLTVYDTEAAAALTESGIVNQGTDISQNQFRYCCRQVYNETASMGYALDTLKIWDIRREPHSYMIMDEANRYLQGCSRIQLNRLQRLNIHIADPFDTLLVGVELEHENLIPAAEDLWYGFPYWTMYDSWNYLGEFAWCYPSCTINIYVATGKVYGPQTATNVIDHAIVTVVSFQKALREVASLQGTPFGWIEHSPDIQFYVYWLQLGTGRSPMYAGDNVRFWPECPAPSEDDLRGFLTPAMLGFLASPAEIDAMVVECTSWFYYGF